MSDTRVCIAPKKTSKCLDAAASTFLMYVCDKVMLICFYSLQTRDTRHILGLYMSQDAYAPSHTGLRCGSKVRSGHASRFMFQHD